MFAVATGGEQQGARENQSGGVGVPACAASLLRMAHARLVCGKRAAATPKTLPGAQLVRRS
ncbi:MAG: hypothetical protein JWN04_6506 [Myxococcaceae bacterium]|nr:hypothetical protein [Myxococcaceae bacterium]